MNFRSISDLSRTIRVNLHKIPDDIDAVIGIPRSGLLAANLISLALNRPLGCVDSSNGYHLLTGHTTRRVSGDSAKAGKLLVVDDSILSGATMGRVRKRFGEEPPADRIVCLAVYGVADRQAPADIVLESCPLPRVFEWNATNHVELRKSCVDLDGVLCFDPEEGEDDDGDTYLKFVNNARIYNLPKYNIHTIVTARLEKYRGETEKWLRESGIKYNNLVMLDLPSAEMRRKLGCHAKFKAEVYRARKDCILFIESELWQAHDIWKATGKSVIAYKDMVYFGEGVQYDLGRRTRSSLRRLGARLVPKAQRGRIKKMLRLN